MSKQDAQPKSQNIYKIDIRKYECDKLVDENGFERLYLIKEKESKSIFAAKVVLCSYDKDNYKQAIIREIDDLMKIHNPTLIRYFGYSLEDFEGKKNATIFMNIHKFKSLSQLLNKARSSSSKIDFSNTNRQILLIGISYGMMFLHQNHILFYDLNPSKVILDSELHPLIIDYNLSKFRHNRLFRKYKKTFYMAPETLKSNIYNSKTDVYSFGALMYEIITNQIPFGEYLVEGQITEETILKYIVEKDLRPSFKQPIKKSIQKLIERCMSKDPNKRPTFEELFQRLAFNDDWGDDFTTTAEQKVTESDLDFSPYFLDGVDSATVFEYIDQIREQPTTEGQRDQAKGLKRELDQLKSQNQGLKGELDQHQRFKDEVKQIMNEYKSQMKLLAQTVADQTSEIKEMKRRYDKAIDEQKDKIESLTKEVKQLKEAKQAKPKYRSEEEDERDGSGLPKLFNRAYRGVAVEDEDKLDLKSGLISPFGIRNLGSTCYMNSSLQCFLSLSTFISQLDSLITTKSHLLQAFKTFIQKHDPSRIKQIVSKTNSTFVGMSQQDSFEFTISFISTMSEENKEGVADLFIGGSQMISKCAKCGFEMPSEQTFSSMVLSIQSSRNIVYVPYSFLQHPVQLTEKPKEGTKVQTRESRTLVPINKFVLMTKILIQYKLIDDVSPDQSSVYAFELPTTELKKGNCFVVVQMKNEKGFPITQPFLCEVPASKEIQEDELKSLIFTRLKDVNPHDYKKYTDRLNKYMRITKPIEFPCKFLPYKKTPTYCQNYITVKISKEEIFDFTPRSVRNQRKDVSLLQLFNSHIKMSQLDHPCKFECDDCKEKSRVFQRTKYTRMPKVLIFQVKRSNGFYDERQPDDTKVSFPHSIAISAGDDQDFNRMVVDPKDKDDDELGEAKKYELRAVTCHTGTFKFGHYWALGKRGEKWYNCNDSMVSKESEPSNPSDSYYVAFYQQLS